MTAFEKLQKLSEQAALVATSAASLSWDQETYLPPAGNEWRGKQYGWLMGRAHEIKTSQEWQDQLQAAAAEVADTGSPRQVAVLKRMQELYERATKLPIELVEREAETSTAAKHAWSQARAEDDFSQFSPYLEKLVAIAREKAELFGYENEPYDALLEDYARGASTEEISKLFAKLQPEVTKIAQAAVERSKSKSASLPAGPYPISQQQEFNQKVAEAMGFDFSAGRIDTTSHPFCTTLGPRDVRLTTRYDEQDFTSSLFGIMHEAGHGLYEQGLPAAEFGTPGGSSSSLDIHESQSRLWENHVGRSAEFWHKWFPVAGQHFPQLRAMSIDDFLAYIHRAEFSFIRVEADEVTYDLHIMLRFDIERKLLSGELQTAEVPRAWNDTFEQYFGMRPPNDSEGCLQDIHWSMGGLAYFPTYTMGNLNAAQLYAAAMKDTQIRSEVAKAEYSSLLRWLREKVHSQADTKLPAEIIRQASGQAPNADAYLSHLQTFCAGRK